MAPLLYISTFISILTAACLAEIVSLRSTPGRSQALAERRKADYHFVPSSSSVKSELPHDLDLLDIVLVASVDGKFHALNRTSGHALWSMSSVPTATSVSAPSTLGPLIRTNHVDHDPELTDDTTHQELYVIEPQSGDIYVMTTPSSPLQRFPFSMSELVDMSPFSFSGDTDRRVFVGRKETSLLLIELETGKVKATLNSECPWDPFEDLHGDDIEVDLDELDGSKTQTSAPTEVFIGRTDYHISIHTRPVNRNSAVPPVQNLSFSTYGPNNQDNHLQATYRRTKDDVYIQSLPNGEIISLKAKARRDSASTSDSQLLWGHTFNNPIVAIFDVLRNSSDIQTHSRNPFVLLQPRPQLQDVIPNLTHDTATARLPNLDSAYVGIVQETGSLFAMSPTRFPLVAFGGAERYTKGRLIDAANGPDTELPVEVDAITKTRKYKEKMEIWQGARCTEESSGDRRCLVGVRRLEDGDGHESRMRRLLDGPTDGRFPALLRPENGNGGAQQVEALAPNNETIGVARVPTGADFNTTTGSNDGWSKAANMWAVMAVILISGIVSFWFGSRFLKSSKNKGSWLVEEKKEDVVDHYSEAHPAKVSDQVVAEHVPEPSTEAHPTPNLPSTSPSPSLSHSVALNGPEQPSATIADDGDDSDREGDVEGDVPVMPGRRKARRGKRGKKKKVATSIPLVDGGGDEETKLINGNGIKVENGHSGSQDLDVSPSSSLVITPPKQLPVTPSLVVSDTILGFGSHGTVVFQGSLQGRAVAVKRLLQDFVTLASREVSILQESDDHPNVIRYYYQEAHANFLYIALELCPASLADIVECPNRNQWRDIAIAFDPKKALKQITSGLKHLHGLKLVHRDIKPQNILVSSAKPLAGGGGKTAYRMLISDFGLCKKLDVDQTSFLPTAHGAMAAGTVGWRAPEILRGEVKLDEFGDDNSMSSRGSVGTATGAHTPGTGKPTRLTKSVDIFALGCLFYYTLTNGEHPFGDRFEREVNILKNAKNLEGLERFGEEGSEANSLISDMLNPEAHARPDTMTCLLHPFFWDSGRRLNFLQDASDRFEIMCRDPKDPYLLTLEKDAMSIVGNDWHSRLDKIFIENLGKFRKYDGRSVQDLLRALRNKKHHYQDMPDNVKRHLGPMPEGFLSYFTRRYPQLFLHVHSVIGSTGLRNESMFRSYFELPD